MSRSFFDRAFLLIVFAIGFFSFTASAQLTRGAVSGTVRDSSGAVIGGVNVKLTNTATNEARTLTTDSNGLYRFVALEPGKYTLSFEATNFTTTEITDVVVATNGEPTVNVDLKPSATSEVVSVTAESIGLNTTSATVSNSYTPKQAVELPLNARNINNLALLSPNAFAAPGSSGISVNGQRARNNNFTIDGSDNNDTSVTIVQTALAPEAISEFQLQTNAYSAEFGRNTGGQINVITKSGSNRFHGQAFEYYTGSALSARSLNEERAGLSRPARFNQSDFGGDFGGRIFRDKTFFYGFVNATRLRQGSSPTGTIRVPTPAGFAALATVPLRTAAGNVPAQSMASRQAVLNSLGFLQNLYASNPVFGSLRNDMVNGVAIQTGTTNGVISQPSNQINYIIRIDHNFNDRNRLTGRYIYTKADFSNVISNTQFGSLFAGDQNTKDYNLAVSDTHIFSPSLVNEFRFSYVRRDLAFPENAPDVPTVGITGFFTVGGLANFPQGRLQDNFQFSDTFSWIYGRHSFKFGADIRYLKLFNLAAFDSKGTFTYNNLADYINNNAFIAQRALQTATFDARQVSQYYFFQDEFRVKSNLTLTMGLRYERNNVPFGFFGATDAQSLAAGVPGPTEADNNNFAPRLGFAWNPKPEGNGFLARALGKGKSTLRGGYGIAYDQLFFNILTVNASNFPRVVVLRQDVVADLFPNVPQGSASPVFNPLAAYVNTPTNAQNPLTQSYSLSFQRELFRDHVVEVGYTGSKSISGINQLQNNPAILTAAQIATVQSTLNAGSIPSAQARRLVPTNGARTLIGTSSRANYNAMYVSVQKRFSKGYSYGLAYTWGKLMSDNDESLGVAAITAGSPQIPQDFNNIRAERAVSAFDRTQRIAINSVYEIPWFKSLPKFTEYLFGGWQVSGIFQAQSGQPFTILTGVDSNGNGTAGDRPNFNAGGIISVDPVTGNFRSFSNNRLTGLANVPVVLANGLPLANSVGNGTLGRNTFRGVGFIRLDLSLLKRIKLTEGHRIELRVDMINAANYRNFGLPVVNMASLDFGSNLSNPAGRNFTISARYAF